MKLITLKIFPEKNSLKLYRHAAAVKGLWELQMKCTIVWIERFQGHFVREVLRAAWI